MVAAAAVVCGAALAPALAGSAAAATLTPDHHGPTAHQLAASRAEVQSRLA